MRFRLWRLALTLLLLAAPRIVKAQPITAIIHGEVIDGNGGPPIDDGVVLFQGDKITAVGSAGVVSVPPGARTIDARGKAVLPGLADMHVHLNGGWDGEAADMLGFQRYLNALLFAGVTSVLDTGNVLPYIQQLRQEVREGRLAGPAIHMAGPLVDGADPVWPPLSIALTSTAQIPDVVRQLKGANVDVVKAYVGLSEREVALLVRAAKAESLPVIIDAGQRNGSAIVAATGISAFAHLGGSPVTDETVSMMVDRHIASITTLAVYESQSMRRLADLSFLREPLLAQTMPPLFIDELKAYATKPRSAEMQAADKAAATRLQVAMKNAKRLSDAGVLLAAGTDAPYPGDYYGEGLHRELELLVEAGLTPLQAISTATRNAASLMKESEIWGTLSPGRRADILVVAGHPAARISDTKKIELVIQAGKVHDRLSLKFDSSKDQGFRATGSTTSR